MNSADLYRLTNSCVFEMLYNLPKTEFAGGVAHEVSEGIYHLIRGEVYTVDRKKIFVMGHPEYDRTTLD